MGGWGGHSEYVLSLSLGCHQKRGAVTMPALPDRLKLDWWRFLIGGGWFLVGEVLAEGAGVTYLGVAGTSYTGPSYIPRDTPRIDVAWRHTRRSSEVLRTLLHTLSEVHIYHVLYLLVFHPHVLYIHTGKHSWPS